MNLMNIALTIRNVWYMKLLLDTWFVLNQKL